MYQSSRHPSSNRASGRPERLLRASVTAFCSIVRPTRRETAQLDDLGVPLLPCVSDDTLRFVAATLSDSPYAPPTLVRRLSDQSIDISAPLLMRSPVLTNIDLIALIGRHGIAHAKAIAARTDLDERIMRLIRSLGAIEDLAFPGRPARSSNPDPSRDAPTAADNTRDHLRSIMRPAGRSEVRPSAPIRLHWDGDPSVYRKLRSTALAGVPALFHTALADTLGIDLNDAQSITDRSDASRFIVGLRWLCDTEEQAFLIFHCLRPAQAANARMTAAFLDAYNAITKADAGRIVDTWRAPEERGGSGHAVAANETSASSRLKAS